jgi:molybdopterin molybdotransferase
MGHEAIGLDEAYRRLMESLAPLKRTQTLPIDQAEGMVLSTSVSCRKALPAFDNSAMDGFAFRYADRGKRLEIVGRILAGNHTPAPRLQAGQCYRIMTGAPVPPDADTVAAIETCIDINDTHVTLPAQIKQGNAVRLRGEETMPGSLLIAQGTRLNSGHVMMLASQGIAEVEVAAPLSIAVASTGDEIREPWEEADEHAIYNANSSALLALLRRYGFNARYVGAIPDDLSESIRTVAQLKGYDVLITTGGASGGDADFIRQAFTANGMAILFHGVRIKPGHPVLAAHLGEVLALGLPGNPLAAWTNLLLLGIPALRTLQGEIQPDHLRITATLNAPLRTRAGRTEAILGRYENGTFTPYANGRYGSGMITPLMESNALAIIPEESTEIAPESEIEVIIF